MVLVSAQGESRVRLSSLKSMKTCESLSIEDLPEEEKEVEVEKFGPHQKEVPRQEAINQIWRVSINRFIVRYSIPLDITANRIH